MRVAYIGYRDIDDEGSDYQHMDVIDFTTDHEAVSAKIESSKAFGGRGDGPEDLNLALEYAKGLNYNSKKLLIYLICDAPCHGDAYTQIYFHRK